MKITTDLLTKDKLPFVQMGRQVADGCQTQIKMLK
jgi:hypothetical protein